MKQSDDSRKGAAAQLATNTAGLLTSMEQLLVRTATANRSGKKVDLLGLSQRAKEIQTSLRALNTELALFRRALLVDASLTPDEK